MTAEAIALLLRDGGPAALAGLFVWLYLSERKANTELQKERISDLKVVLETVHKDIGLLEDATAEMRRGRPL